MSFCLLALGRDVDSATKPLPRITTAAHKHRIRFRIREKKAITLKISLFDIPEEFEKDIKTTNSLGYEITQIIKISIEATNSNKKAAAINSTIHQHGIPNNKNSRLHLLLIFKKYTENHQLSIDATISKCATFSFVVTRAYFNLKDQNIIDSLKKNGLIFIRV